MSILGIGVDVLHLPRLASFIHRRTAQKLASRILSDAEWATWENISSTDLPRRHRFLAVRWSVKEAAYKALYPYARPTWKQLTLHGLQDGPLGRKPALEYHRHDATGCDIGKIHASISHDGEYVYTTVLVEGASADV
ncbi:4'-phosphopantetheinyl transferase [Amylocystis lapponica]|nr:4'-phosphopantetheinyl transferase [Amylocystis lapponica]